MFREVLYNQIDVAFLIILSVNPYCVSCAPFSSDLIGWQLAPDWLSSIQEYRYWKTIGSECHQ